MGLYKEIVLNGDFHQVTANSDRPAHACLYLTRLPDPSSISSSLAAAQSGFSVCSIDPPDLPSHLTYSMNQMIFWASTAKPDASNPEFAIAANDRVIRVVPNESSWDFNYRDLETETDVFAVDWLSENILLNGFRDRRVVLWDTRSAGNPATKTRIWSPSCVIHVRAFDQYRVVVAGTDGEVRIIYSSHFSPSYSDEHVKWDLLTQSLHETGQSLRSSLQPNPPPSASTQQATHAGTLFK